MNGFRDYLRGSAALFSDILGCSLVLYLLPLLPGVGLVRVPVLVWAAFLAVQLLVNLVLTWRGISMNGYLIWNGAAILCGAFLVGREAASLGGGATFTGVTAVCAAATGFHGAYAAWRLPQANGLLRYVDCLVVLLAFYLYAEFQLGWEQNQELLLGAVLVLLLDLLAVNKLRTGEGDVNLIMGAGAASRLVLAGIVLGILAVTGVIVGFASGQIHSAVDLFIWFCTMAAKVLDVVFLIIGTVIGWLVILLVYLWPATPSGMKENARAMIQESAEEIVEETGLTLPLWFWQLLGAVLIAVFAAWILYICRNVRLRREAPLARKRRVVRKSHVFSELRRLAGKLAAAVAFEIQYRKQRRTLAGLLVYADRLGRRVKSKENGRRESLGRHKEESPGEYMRRLAGYMQAAGGEAGDVERLRRLARQLDEAYYGGKSGEISRESCVKYEKILQKCFAKEFPCADMH